MGQNSKTLGLSDCANNEIKMSTKTTSQIQRININKSAKVLTLEEEKVQE